MTFRAYVFLGIVAALCAPSLSSAQKLSVKDCDAALAKDVITVADSQLADLLVSSLITTENYNEIKKEAGGASKAFGVSYDETESATRNTLQRFGLSFHRESLRNFSQYYLSDNSTKAYGECLAAVTKLSDSDSISISIKYAGPEEVIAIIAYGGAPLTPDPVPLTLVSNFDSKVVGELPRKIYKNSEIPVIFKRKCGKPLILTAKAGEKGVAETIPEIFDLQMESHIVRLRGHPVVKAFCGWPPEKRLLESRLEVPSDMILNSPVWVDGKVLKGDGALEGPSSPDGGITWILKGSCKSPSSSARGLLRATGTQVRFEIVKECPAKL